jgi:hypothetical protein
MVDNQHQHPEIIRIIGGMAAAYPNFTVPRETFRVYAHLLEDIPLDLLRAAVSQAIATSEWFPTVAKLRQIAGELQARVSGQQPPTPFEAWAEVKRNILRPAERREWSHPLVLRAINTLGGMDAYGQSDIDDEGVWRAHFARAYEQLLTRCQDDAKLLPTVRDAVERLRLESGPGRPLRAML